MAQISSQLLEYEWETYNGIKLFLGEDFKGQPKKSTSFGQDMDKKYAFEDEKLLVLSDDDAYKHIKANYVIELEEYK